MGEEYRFGGKVGFAVSRIYFKSFVLVVVEEFFILGGYRFRGCREKGFKGKRRVFLDVGGFSVLGVE